MTRFGCARLFFVSLPESCGKQRDTDGSLKISPTIGRVQAALFNLLLYLLRRSLSTSLSGRHLSCNVPVVVIRRMQLWSAARLNIGLQLCPRFRSLALSFLQFINAPADAMCFTHESTVTLHQKKSGSTTLDQDASAVAQKCKTALCPI